VGGPQKAWGEVTKKKGGEGLVAWVGGGWMTWVGEGRGAGSMGEVGAGGGGSDGVVRDKD
jgi:hypothetical protein